MPEYWYSALTGRGAVEEGWMNAASEVVVEQELRRQGWFLIRAEARARDKRLSGGRIDRRELREFLEYLAASFSAGVPLLTALDEATAHLRTARLRAIVSDVRRAIAEDGRSLSEALSEHPRTFPQLLVSAIQAGEASGRLGFSLDELVENLDWQDDIASSVRRAVMAPLMALLAVALLSLGFVGFLAPNIPPVLLGPRTGLPLITRAVISTALFFWHNAIVLAALMSAVVAGYILLRRTARGRFLLDSLVLRVPVVGQIVLDMNMARVVAYLSLYYKTGVDLLQSLRLVESLVTNRVIVAILRDARVRVENGESLAAAFGRFSLVPIVVMRSLSLSESSGRLDHALDRARAYYARSIPSALRRASAFVQPVAVIVLCTILVVGALAVTLPVLSLYESIGIRR